MIPCYCTNMVGNTKISIYCTKISCHFAFLRPYFTHTSCKCDFFTFYHSSDGSVGIPIHENIEIDTSFSFLCQLLMKIKPFLNVHTSIGGHLGFGHFMDTRGKLSLALYLKSFSTSLTSTMPILVLLPPNPQSILFLPHIRLTKTCEDVVNIFRQRD